MNGQNALRAHFRSPLGFAVLLTASAASVMHAQSSRDGFSTPSVSSDTNRPALQPQPLFFPPNPPPLGRAVGRAPVPVDPRLPAAPPELAAYVNEFFYPALGARLFTQSLKEPLRRQLESYRAAKLALQHELRNELARLRQADPAQRLEALTALARAQAPRLAQLEKDTEQLRRDLILSDYTWNAQREWRLGDRDRRGFSPIEVAEVMRGYAFYHNSLLPAQRRLLREISIELLLSAEDQAKATVAQPHVFFPPEPARVLFPESISAQAAAKLASYQTQKSALKKELYDAVHRHDGYTLDFLRGNTLAALAEKQAARLAALETLAEEIRRLLPPTTELLRPTLRSALPVALSDRIRAMITAYAQAQRSAAARIDAIVAQAKALPFHSSYRFDADGLKFVVVPTREARVPAALKKIEAVRAEISTVADDYGRTLAELINEREAIRAEIGATIGSTNADAIDAALYATMRVLHQQQAATDYEEYRVAVFEPGLSPEQRRVLFDGVIEQLALPLPRAELQPTRRAATW